MKETKKTKFLDWNYNVLADSVKKIGWNVVLIIAVDLLFYLIASYIARIWFQRIIERVSSFNLPVDVFSLGQEGAQQLAKEMRAFSYFLVFSFVLLLITIVFLASILKGIIWAKTTQTKITFKLISKFMGLNLIWMSFWFALVVLVPLVIDKEFVAIYIYTAIILGVYFTNTVYTLFMQRNLIKSITDGIKLNLTKIHLLLLPYMIVALLLYVIVKITQNLRFRYAPILNLVILLAYVAVVRFYISTLVLKIEELN